MKPEIVSRSYHLNLFLVIIITEAVIDVNHITNFVHQLRSVLPFWVLLVVQT